jgi:hypothetical protein
MWGECDSRTPSRKSCAFSSAILGNRTTNPKSGSKQFTFAKKKEKTMEKIKIKWDDEEEEDEEEAEDEQA